jgi:hypothetical protein
MQCGKISPTFREILSIFGVEQQVKQITKEEITPCVVSATDPHGRILVILVRNKGGNNSIAISGLNCVTYSPLREPKTLAPFTPPPPLFLPLFHWLDLRL